MTRTLAQTQTFNDSHLPTHTPIEWIHTKLNLNPTICVLSKQLSRLQLQSRTRKFEIVAMVSLSTHTNIRTQREKHREREKKEHWKQLHQTT